MQFDFFETIAIEEGKPRNIAFHQMRYERVLAACGVVAKKSLREAIEKAFTMESKELFRCKVLYNTKEQMHISFYPYTKRKVERLKAVRSEIAYDKKYTDRRELDALFWQRGECDDVLICTSEGMVQDTTIANVAFLREGIWYTPKRPLLQGTVRERLLQEGFLSEVEIYLENIGIYEGMALMNAMIDFDIIKNKKTEDIIC